MSNGVKRAVFVALASVVVVVVIYAMYGSGKTVSTAQQNTQTQVDPATIQRIQSLENTIKTDPKDVKTLTELGQLYFETGDVDKAQVAFKAALELEPNNAALHNGLGIAYFWTGKTQEAIAEYRKSMEIDPSSPEAYYFLALTLSHSQPSDIPGAIENWEKVIKLAPDSQLAKQSQQYIDQSRSSTSDRSSAPPLAQTKP